ncbi:hypothetical protein DBV33_16730 [Pseudomonas fluorescens]|nr:hypothetical protein DBV33_16730 [Pseudomonas fluorescens]
MWERACSRSGQHSQHPRRLTHRYREQACSHRFLRRLCIALCTARRPTHPAHKSGPSRHIHDTARRSNEPVDRQPRSSL